MIEAVNSVIANASVARVATAPTDAARAAANPARVQEAAGATQGAPYLTLSIYVDVNYDQAVIRLRDSETGDVLSQIPSEGRLEARQREQTATNVVFQTTARQIEEYTNVAQSGVTTRGASVSEFDTSVPDGSSSSSPSVPAAQVAQAALSTGGGVSVFA